MLADERRGFADDQVGAAPPIETTAASSADALARTASQIAPSWTEAVNDPLGPVDVRWMIPRLAGSGYGSGRRRIASARLKTAVHAPMTSARVTMAVEVKAGVRRRTRTA